jgi:hypothetical protein
MAEKRSSAATFTCCERCTATIRKPAHPQTCPVCDCPLLSREQLNEPEPPPVHPLGGADVEVRDDAAYRDDLLDWRFTDCALMARWGR